MKLNKIIFTGLFILVINELFSQHAPLGMHPTQFIPSFAGSAGEPRIFANIGSKSYHRQDDRNAFGGSLSFDHFITKWSTGVGFNVDYLDYTNPATDRDSIPDEANMLKFQLMAAPKFSIAGKYTISPGIAISYNHMAHKGDFLNYGKEYTELADTSKLTENKINFAASILFNSKKYYAGISFYSRGFYSHDQGIGANTFLTARRKPFLVFQTGYTFQRTSESKFSFTPQLAIAIHSEGSNVSFVDLNLKFRYKKVIWGLYGDGLYLGYQNDKISITGALSLKEASSASLSARILLGNKSQKSTPGF